MQIKADIKKIVLSVCHDDVFVDILHLRRLRLQLEGTFSLKPSQILFKTLKTIFGDVSFHFLVTIIRHSAPSFKITDVPLLPPSKRNAPSLFHTLPVHRQHC